MIADANLEIAQSRRLGHALHDRSERPTRTAPPWSKTAPRRPGRALRNACANTEPYVDASYRSPAPHSRPMAQVGRRIT
jgi:hypothetical protein